MLRKLLKYDFRSMWKQFSVIWPAALAIAFLNRFTLFGTAGGADWTGEAAGILGVITLSVFMGIMFAMFVVSMVYVLGRFYKGLLGDEGYLMHTLPVKSWQLVASKLICAAAVTVVNGLVACISMLLMMPMGFRDLLDVELWGQMLRGIAKHPDILLYLVEFCLMMGAALSFCLTMVYLSMAIGHLFARRRVLMSVAAFFGLYILCSLAMALLARTGLLTLVEWIISAQGHWSFWAAILMTALPAALFFAVTSYLLKHRLNLE